MTEKQLKKYADLIAKCEKEHNEAEIIKLTTSLSISDLLEIDSYIQEKKLLTK